MSSFLLGVVASTAVLDWICTAILIRGAAARPSVPLKERAGVSLVLAIAITAYLAVGVNTQLGFPVLNVEAAAVSVRLILTFVGIIPARWLWLYWRGRFA